MTAVFGWMVILAGLSSLSVALVWPAFILVRRIRPRTTHARWVYIAAVASCDVALWWLIPVAVRALFHRTVH